MWEAIKYVGSGVTLIAFIAAVSAWIYKLYIQGRENLIKSVPEDKRAQLVEKTFVLFNVDAAKLSREHQYELALRQIQERTRKFLTVAVVIVIIAALLTLISFVAIPRLNPAPVPSSSPTSTPTPERLMGKIERVEVVPGHSADFQVLINLSIANTGAPTSVHRYNIHIDHVSSKSINYDGPPEEISEPIKVPQAGGNQAVVIQPGDSILSKTKQAIGNERVDGWLKLSLPLPKEVLEQHGIRYTVSFADVTDKTYQVTYVVP